MGFSLESSDQPVSCGDTSSGWAWDRVSGSRDCVVVNCEHRDVGVDGVQHVDHFCSVASDPGRDV